MSNSWRLREPEYSLGFNSADESYLEVEDDPALQFEEGSGFTTAFWFEATDDAENGSPLSKGHGTGGDVMPWYLWRYRDDNQLNWMVRNGDGEDSNVETRSLTVGEVYHAVGVYRGEGGIEIYIDASSEDSASAPLGNYGNNGEPLQIGPHSSGWLDATVDDLRIYDRALSGEEIEALYDGEHIEDGLVGYWPLDDGSGETASDRSGNGNDGTLVNGPDWTEPLIIHTTEPDVTDVYVKDAFNRFAREATVEIDDPTGEKEPQYPQAKPVILEPRRDIDPDYHPRFGGFVIDTKTDDNTLELEILSHDFWLRRRSPVVSYENELISAVLKHLIENFTPLVWNPDLIEIENDAEITREFRAEPLDAIIDQLTARSAGEEFGANNDGEFFVRPRDTTAAPIEFDESTIQPGSAEFEEDAKAEVNRVEIHYGEGDNSAVVAVQDRGSQRELQEELGAPRPVVIETKEDHPEISSEREAERLGRKHLEGRTTIRTGELETWEAFGVQPGMVAPVDIPEQNVNDDYRIAQIEYDWGEDRTSVTLAENQEGVSDVLVELSDEVTRVDMKNADPDAAVSEHLDTSSGAELGFDASVTTREFGEGTFSPGINADSLGINTEREFGISFLGATTTNIRAARATNTANNRLRDVWRGDATPPDLSRLLLGDGDSLPSRTDTGMENTIETLSPTVRTPGDTLVRFIGSTTFETATEISEIGIDDAEELFARYAIEEISVPEGAVADVMVEVEALNDPDQQSDLTTSGRESVRDIVANNGPRLPSSVGYGTGDQDLSENDTQLGNEVASVPIAEFENSGTGVTYVRSILDGADADGEDIQELGQFNGDGSLLTYVTFAQIPVTSGMEIVTNDKTQFSNQ